MRRPFCRRDGSVYWRPRKSILHRVKFRLYVAFTQEIDLRQSPVWPLQEGKLILFPARINAPQTEPQTP